uniref:Uncharacterized protein n=1 Tax=Nelumbo nucifera TaxID=4432 RepID=A0A822YDH6_NELNU|nr:TPA_asm: hypothetical protein HUJ06_030493 [Nelumbo nucifera]
MGKSQCPEAIGTATADCAVLCCCCPCGFVNLILMALYKIPAGLCRKAFRKRRKKLPYWRGYTRSPDIDEMPIRSETDNLHRSEDEKWDAQLDKEIETIFGNSGFWRRESRSAPNRRSQQIDPTTFSVVHH